MSYPKRKCYPCGHLIGGVAIFWLCCFGGTIAVKNDINESLLEDVLVSLEKAVDFFGKDFSGVNLDGLYGLRICQGRIIESLEDCKKDNFTCPPGVVHRLEVVRDKLKTMTDAALPYVKEANPVTTSAFIHIIEAPFHVKYIPEWLGDEIGPIGSDKSYHGGLGDFCCATLMGRLKYENGSLYPKCYMNEFCWRFITRPNTSDYFITHQLLYYIYGEAVGCTPAMNKSLKEFNGNSVRDMEKNLCGRIFNESIWLSKDGTVKAVKRDLFTEQSIVCGLLGFQDFFKADWMRMLISWQTSNGCWTVPEYVEYFEKQKQGKKDLSDTLQRKGPGRKLLTESLMKDDCLSHNSGLATGLLGIHTRYLIEHLYGQHD